jgi:hypothetical protein
VRLRRCVHDARRKGTCDGQVLGLRRGNPAICGQREPVADASEADWMRATCVAGYAHKAQGHRQPLRWQRRTAASTACAACLPAACAAVSAGAHSSAVSRWWRIRSAASPLFSTHARLTLVGFLSLSNTQLTLTRPESNTHSATRTVSSWSLASTARQTEALRVADPSRGSWPVVGSRTCTCTCCSVLTPSALTRSTLLRPQDWASPCVGCGSSGRGCKRRMGTSASRTCRPQRWPLPASCIHMPCKRLPC